MRTRLALVVLLVLVPSALFAGKPAPAPSFTPAIVYVQARSNGGRDLVTMDSTGSITKVLVTGSSIVSPGSPAFSPDGSRIVYRYGAALYVIPTAGGNPWKLVDLAQDHGWNVPAWSPDGRFILYSDTTGPSAICSCTDRDLFLVEVDATGHAVAGTSVRLTSTTAQIEYQPAWSRDGLRFVAKVWIDPNEEQLFLFDFDPVTRSITGSHSLTAGLGKMYFGPWRAQWSKGSVFPNDVVAFSAHFPNDGSNYDLWYIDATTFLAGHIVATTVNYEGSPSFSPDGSRLVFHNENAASGSPHDLSIVENAADLILGTAPTPVITHTAAKASGKVFDVYECDWNPVVP